MLKIRLQRAGKKNSPSYRVVLAEHTAPPQGKFQEILGYYNPRKKEKSFKKERIEYWLKQGAQLSATVHNLLIDEGIFEGVKLRAWKPKQKKKVEEPKSAEKEQPKKESEEKSEEKKSEEKSVTKPKEEAKKEEAEEEETTEKPKEKGESKENPDEKEDEKT